MVFFILFACFVAVQGSGVYQEVHSPQPYKFGYTIKDKEGVQHREEAGNGAGVVKGNYGFLDNKGKMRQVEYVADHGGFRAQIKTNEPGTAGQSPAAVNLISNDPYAQGGRIPYNSRINDPYVPALYNSDAYGFPTVYNFNPNVAGYGGQLYGYGYNGNRGLNMQPRGTVYFGANYIDGVITGQNSLFAVV